MGTFERQSCCSKAPDYVYIPKTVFVFYWDYDCIQGWEI